MAGEVTDRSHMECHGCRLCSRSNCS